MARLQEKGCDERADFPPGFGNREVTGGPFGREPVIQAGWLPNQGPSIRCQARRNRLGGIGHLDMPIHDRAVTET
jgi:hypothetical protein